MKRELFPCGEDCWNCPCEDCGYDEPEPEEPPRAGPELSEASMAALKRLWAQRDKLKHKKK